MHDSKREDSLGLFLILSLILVLAGFLGGFFWPHHFDSIVQPALQKVEKIGKTLPQNSPWHGVLTIFLNNALIAVEFVLLGVLLGVYPAFMLLLNGTVIGVVSALVVAKTHATLTTVLLYAILPHGIFELSALIWAGALGCNLGFTGGRWTLRYLRRTMLSQNVVLAMRGEQTFRAEAWRAIKSLPWIIGMLFIAACIEGLVTPHLIHLAGL